MPLADTPPATKKRALCGVAKLNLDEADTATLHEWLGNHSDASIAERLTEHTGISIGYQSISRHRQQRCSCYRG